MSGDVTVISGPTAVGKGTVVQALKARHPEVWVSVSATTRPPRPTEVDGVHYHFIDAALFDRMAARGELLPERALLCQQPSAETAGWGLACAMAMLLVFDDDNSNHEAPYFIASCACLY